MSDPSEARGNSVTARELLDKGAAQIGSDLASQPRVAARMMNVMGEVYTSLGLYEDSATLLAGAPLPYRKKSLTRTTTDLA